MSCLRDYLTPTEYLVARLVAEGLKNKEIAVVVGRSEHVVKNLMKSIYDKSGSFNRTELALRLLQQESFTCQ
jgi:DNA-binding NarL/FixJ family response regulator